MTIIEIISAILLILSCVFIIAVVLMQESKRGMSNVISGGSADNYFQKNSGRTKEAKLSRATKIAAVVLFVVAIAVNLISVYSIGGDNSQSSSNNVINLEDIDFSEDATDDEGGDTSDDESSEAETEAAGTEAAETEAAETEAPAETEAAE